MATDFTANICGGVRWRTNPGGIIELEGLGIPLLDPASAKFQNLARTWKNFGEYLGAAADKSGIPRSWALAFATVETGFLSADYQKQAEAVSGAGAVGVMQLMPQYFSKYSRAELLDPSVNIPVGVGFIKKLCASSACPWRCELPYLGSVYNAGSGSNCVQCSPGKNAFNFFEDADYSMQLVSYNNSALTYLKLGEAAWPWMLGGAIVAGAGAAAWLWL
ncbi:MAG TPA: transglycosylase SLT domain-containing protein [Gemmatimonadaceae bacterium]|nr:transglycosylase SLT domain-containing protein [Gemmatimonadaceae bacterium]